MIRLIKRMKTKFKRYLWKKICDHHLFCVRIRERVCRQEFFYNAFMALSFNGIDGDYVEFGCCSGLTFALSYHEAQRNNYKTKLWAFDSFQGFPESAGAKDDHPLWNKGEMMTSLDQFYLICDDNKVPRSAYTVVPGFYNETLSEKSSDNLPNNIALVYIDCDMYSSTKTVLEFLTPRLKHGMIIAFDDYFCWSKTQIAGERRAALELFAKNPRWELVPYMNYGWHGKSFFVEDKKISGQ